MLRLRINWTGSIQGFTVWHFLGDDDQTAADAAASAANTFLEAIDGLYRNSVTAAVDPEVFVVNVGTGHVEGTFSVSSFAQAGDSSDAMVPNAAMALIRWRTGVFTSGRELRGRTFIPGLTDTAVDATGNLATAAAGTLQSAADTLVSTSDFAVWGSTTAQAATVTSASVWSEFAVLRSRRD
uniref:Uncharacterized protein n=1 Tax=uncultured prokaryote TaxID=198431 RepID=A0A0H5Q0D7_9ZZZZ|nr:hypothetical protein [uncultured prokaryote]